MQNGARDSLSDVQTPKEVHSGRISPASAENLSENQEVVRKLIATSEFLCQNDVRILT